MPIRFVRFDPKRAHSDGKFEDRGLPVLGLPRGRGSFVLSKSSSASGNEKGVTTVTKSGNCRATLQPSQTHFS